MPYQLLAKLSTLVLYVIITLEGQAQTGNTLFKLLPPAQTGLSFRNDLTESDSINILQQANIYNGGGIGVGDFNNDGLPDISFAGNMVANKLYLNKGALKFADITEEAAVSGYGRWCTGVSVIDINADGWLDIYVSASFRKDAPRRTNLLYINQGLNKNGIPVFKEMAAAFGLADDGFSTQGYFFDYDKDGDLDLYQVTNALYDPKTPIRFRPKVTDGSALNTDRLYRNNGDNTFTNVSQQAGILIEGWGHAACIADFNSDGWPDIYVANDFVSNDILYINNHDGTFTDRLSEYFKHSAWNAMGTDAVDINNDGWLDLISLEMLPEDNLRKKRMLSGNEYYNYFNASQYGYQHQYVRNVLQLNSGMTPGGHPVFSDVGFLSGIYQTDWSWCPLVADFDNDGLRDMVITNGLPRDVTDLDYIAYDNQQGGGAPDLSLSKAHTLPVVKIPNYSFKNKDGIQFENTSAAWGFTQSSFSNGGVYADLDNDGDLDIVVNNINDDAFLYENTSFQQGLGNRLPVKLIGPAKNKQAIGTRLFVYYGGKKQYYEHQPCRGYLSTVDERAHFGLGAATTVDSVKVIWPDGKTQWLHNVPANQLLTITYANTLQTDIAATTITPVFRAVQNEYNIVFKPVERDFVDYTIQPTLPHKLSEYGPGIAVGDIDKNGVEDFYLGGTSGNHGVFFMQDKQGKFTIDTTRITREGEELEEEMGVLFFDADNDGDLDLYAVSGSYEIPPGHPVMQDRLYINNGKGVFKKAIGALPVEITNGSCVRAADFDKDGDLDLFVGGRVVSGAYPSNPEHYILKNNGSPSGGGKGEVRFTNVTTQLCPSLKNLGMVTDALWTDIDNDGKVDLVIAGEWMPITIFKNTGTGFVPITKTSGLAQYSGWWNSLIAGDFDNDGDIDFVAGNLGLNSNYTATEKEPMTIYAKDMDKNGSLDAMLFCYMRADDGSRKPFPMHAKDDLAGQLVSVRKKYPTYKSYGMASMNELWPEPERVDAMVKTANYMQTSYIENKGKGQFVIKPMPIAVQTAPIFGMLSEDVDSDGNLDLLLVGNDYGMEPYSGRHDAFNGLYMKGDGRGNFTPLTVNESGFFVKGAAKALAKIHTAKNEDIWVATQNQDSVLVFAKTNTENTSPVKWIELLRDDFYADIHYKNGKKRRVEFYYGSGYLSQSSRKLAVEKDAVKITIHQFNGNKREVL